MTRSVLGALAICAAAALLEGLFAGRNVKSRLMELRQPPHSPPFAVWIGIGVCYYLICFVVLTRLIESRQPLRWTALALVTALLIGNAVWNLVFFKYKNLEACTIVSMIYGAVALTVTFLLIRVDPVSAWVFLPYVIYLAYATWWVLALRRLNRGVGREAA